MKLYQIKDFLTEPIRTEIEESFTGYANTVGVDDLQDMINERGYSIQTYSSLKGAKYDPLLGKHPLGIDWFGDN